MPPSLFGWKRLLGRHSVAVVVTALAQSCTGSVRGGWRTRNRCWKVAAAGLVSRQLHSAWALGFATNLPPSQNTAIARNITHIPPLPHSGTCQYIYLDRLDDQTTRHHPPVAEQRARRNDRSSRDNLRNYKTKTGAGSRGEEAVGRHRRRRRSHVARTGMASGWGAVGGSAWGGGGGGGGAADDDDVVAPAPAPPAKSPPSAYHNSSNPTYAAQPPAPGPDLATSSFGVQQPAPGGFGSSSGAYGNANAGSSQSFAAPAASAGPGPVRHARLLAPGLWPCMQASSSRSKADSRPPFPPCRTKPR